MLLRSPVPISRRACRSNLGRHSGRTKDQNIGYIADGSYPFFDPQHGPNTNVVLRARDAQKLASATRAVEDMLQRVRGAQSSGG